MLLSLHISNYAIIDHLDLKVSDRLTTITGETGAGKSILIGALGLALGERADNSVLHQDKAKCVVEAHFSIGNLGLGPFFEQSDIDYDHHCIVRREINAAGRSRAFVNDTPVKLEVLRLLGAKLIDLHRQHETVQLSSDAFQLQLTDALAGHQSEVLAFAKEYRGYVEAARELNALRERGMSAANDLEYILFQLNELNEANLSAGEDMELEKRQSGLAHSEEIQTALDESVDQLTGERSALDAISHIEAALEKVSRFEPRAESLAKRLKSVRIELDDVASELSAIREETTSDPEEMQRIGMRLDALYKLFRKHNVKSAEELVEKRIALEQQSLDIEGTEEKVQQLANQIEALKSKLLKKATVISNARREAARYLASRVKALLPEVGMPGAQFSVEVSSNEDSLSATGFDNVHMLFSANVGSPAMEIRKVASGGELSRLMLVIKSLVAKSSALPTLVFDEIDEGISGETARKIGTMLQKLAAAHQVVCITHLPQIAAKGDKHYFVYKASSKGRTSAFVRSLDTNERIMEIAKMLSGEKPTTAAMENAKELLTLN